MVLCKKRKKNTFKNVSSYFMKAKAEQKNLKVQNRKKKKEK